MPPKAFFFLECEDLFEQPRPILDQLQQFLCLDHPLSESYAVNRWVGCSGIGDPSEHIKSGRLLARNRRIYDERAIPDEFRAAYEKYRDLRATLVAQYEKQNA